MPKTFVITRASLGQSCAQVPKVLLLKMSGVWQLVWLVNSGVAARLSRASGQKVCRQEGHMAGASPGEEHRRLGQMLTQLRGRRV